MSFPHVRAPGRCELCGADVGEQQLRTVTLAESGKKANGAWRDRRVVYVCARHPVEDPTATLRAAAVALRTTALGTSRNHPQTETLFGYVTPPEHPS